MLDIHANKIIANKFVGEFENINNNDGISIGMIIPYSGNNEIPNGFLLCNGASVRKDTYIDLFNIIGTIYGSIDEEHFNLPNLNDRFLEGSNTSGIYKEAGLPNITGSYKNYIRYTSNLKPIQETAGVYSVSDGYGIDNVSGTNATRFPLQILNFDASRSNPTYGSSDTVQPNSLTIRYIIKAFNGINTNSTTDLEITQLANDLADKANRSLSNTANNVDFVVENYSDEDGNWYRLYKSGWIEQGGYILYASPATITLLKPFTDSTYNISTQAHYVSNYSYQASVFNKTVTTFNLIPGTDRTTNWYACGQG